MQAALEAIQQEGYPVQEEDLAHLWPIRFAHIHRYGKYTFDVEAARTRVGLRPLKPLIFGHLLAGVQHDLPVRVAGRCPARALSAS